MRRLSTLFCSHLMFSVLNHGNFCQCCSGSEIPKAVCLQLIVFYISVSTRLPRVSTDLLSSLGVKAGRERGRTLSWNATGLGWFHMVGRENSDSLPHSVIHHVFTECDIWPDLCICVWDKRTVMGLWEFLVQEALLLPTMGPPALPSQKRKGKKKNFRQLNCYYKLWIIIFGSFFAPSLCHLLPKPDSLLAGARDERLYDSC